MSARQPSARSGRVDPMDLSNVREWRRSEEAVESALKLTDDRREGRGDVRLSTQADWSETGPKEQSLNR